MVLYCVNVKSLNASADASENEKQKRKKKVREARDQFYRLFFEKSYSMHRRSFHGIFAASLVPFDERIPRRMPAENIRRWKNNKNSGRFRGELVRNLVRIADIPLRRCMRTWWRANKSVRYRYNHAVIVIARLSLRGMRKIFREYVTQDCDGYERRKTILINIISKNESEQERARMWAKKRGKESAKQRKSKSEKEKNTHTFIRNTSLRNLIN